MLFYTLKTIILLTILLFTLKKSKETALKCLLSVLLCLFCSVTGLMAHAGQLDRMIFKGPFNLNYSMIPNSALLLKQRVPLSGDKNVLQRKNAEKMKSSHLYFWLHCPKPNCSTYIQIRQERKFETNPKWDPWHSDCEQRQIWIVCKDKPWG